MKSLRFLVTLGIAALNMSVFAQTEVSGIISANTTWPAGSYILKGNVTVRNNAILTVQKDALVDLANYQIQLGSTSAGILNASEASFISSSATDRKILFMDGGGGSINKCTFNNVYADLESDASSSVTITNSSFSGIDYPVTMDINRVPSLSGNSSDKEMIGLSGTLNSPITLPKYAWKYVLTASITVRNSSMLTIAGGSTMDLGNFSVFIGSTSSGELIADDVQFDGAGTTDRIIMFKDGGKGTVTNCRLANVAIGTETDAGSPVTLTDNVFISVQYPVNAAISRVPVCSGNTSPVEKIGIYGSVTESCTLSKQPWDYIVTSSVTVRNNAVLSIGSGVSVDLAGYLMTFGSSTPGILNAEGVSFKGTGTSDRSIVFAAGGKGNINRCSFDNVYINLHDDAGTPVTLTENDFENIQYPVKMNPLRAPVMSGNISSVELVGISGYVNATCTLSPLQWDYCLTDQVTVNSNAVLTISPDVNIFLNNKTLYTGASSSNKGELRADGVRFFDLSTGYGKIEFRANSTGNITNCSFENSRVNMTGASPTISNSRLFHCKYAVYVSGASSPVLTGNDFYNNETAIYNIGTGSVNAENNYWAHPSGPQHEGNPGGEGEVISGNADYTPFLAGPARGTINGVLEPENITYTGMITGQRKDSSFVIINNGDEDLLITSIHSNTSSVSVNESDRFWILPDSSRRIGFSFTSLQYGVQKDTIILHSNNEGNPDLAFTVECVADIEGLILNFYHIDVDSFPVVRCHFTVTDQAGLPVRTLTKQDLDVSEQDIPINDFQLILRSSSTLVKVAMVMDRSGSMSGQRIRDMKNAAGDFVNLLSPVDQAAIISFNEDPRLDLNFTSDKTTLVNKINSLSAKGNTSVFDAIWMAIENIKNQQGIRAILALTDGQDNSSDKTPPEIIAAANQYGINIYSIGLGIESEPTMSQIAEQTGGQYFYAPTSAELALIYRAISGQIQNLYIIRYVASTTLPYPRKVELEATVYDMSGSDIRYYSMGNFTIDFLRSTQQPLRNEEFSLASKSYFYYYINEATNTLPAGYQFDYFMEARGKSLPCRGEYLGNGVLQFWIDFNPASVSGDYIITLPDSVKQAGGWVKFTNKPVPFTVDVNKRIITESIDIFAGGSVGAKVMAGAVGAGPSIAAASASSTGTAGMGITFERDQKGNEEVSRRLEAGYSNKVEAPSINTVVDFVKAGVSAEVTYKGTVGQTMAFPANPTDKNTMLKAKAAYLLETMALGGLAVSPYFAVVLEAIQLALIAINPDVDQIYLDLYKSWNAGVSIEGKVGAEFKLEAGKSSGLPSFTFAEASQSMALSGTFEHDLDEDQLTFGMGLATAFDLGLLNVEVGDYKLGSIFRAKGGAEALLGAVFSTSDGFDSFNMSFLSYDAGNVLYLQGFYGDLYSIRVPRAVIADAMNTTGNLIYNVGQLFEDGTSIPDLRVGAAYFTDALDGFFGLNEDSLGSVEDHITFNTDKQYGAGLSADIKVGLDGALGVGAGLEFGVNFAYLDKIEGPINQYTFAHGKILPLADYAGITPKNKLFSIKDEFTDMVDGVIKLVADGISNLVDVAEYLVDAGTDLAMDAFDKTCELGGEVVDGGKVILRKMDPTHWLAINQPFMEPVIIKAYCSDRVSYGSRPGTLKSGNEEKGKMYLVSDAYNISMFNTSNDLVNEFQPLRLNLSIDPVKLAALDFKETDKLMARIYRYIPETIGWELVGNDMHAHPDSVAADIGLSGTYAIGIELFPEQDKTAPEILDYYPKQGNIIGPDETLWAKLFEDPKGVGIDFSVTRILVDGYEKAATWDPVNSVIAFDPDAPLTIGNHQFTVEVADFNGNSTTQTVSFTVQTSGIEENQNKPALNFICYPNPASEEVIIETESYSTACTDLAVYDLSGRRIVGLFTGTLPAGSHKFTWNRLTGQGTRAVHGICFIRIVQGERIFVKKILLD